MIGDRLPLDRIGAPALAQPVGEYLEYLREIRQLSDNTVTAYSSDLARYIEFLVRAGVRSWDALHLTHVDRFILSQDRRGIGRASVARHPQSR